MGWPRSPLSRLGQPGSFDLAELGETKDPLDWQLWWLHHRDRYLTRDRFRTRERMTSTDDFYLGRNQRDAGLERELAQRSAIDRAAEEALVHFLGQGGKHAPLGAALLAAGSAELATLQRQTTFSLQLYLRTGREEPAAAAVVAVGATGDLQHVPLLLGLVRDDDEARASVGGTRIPETIRGLAATAVGLLAGTAPESELAKEVVAALAEVIVTDGMPRAVVLGAIEGLGLVPLPPTHNQHICFCGECARRAPNASFQAQATFVLEHVVGNREFDPLVRAQAVTALGRLIGARLDAAPEAIKFSTVEVLARLLDSRTKQPAVVREAAVLALGLVADADRSTEDDLARYSLLQAVRHGGKLEQRYALTALAQSGVRRGQSAAPFDATGEVEGQLMHQLMLGSGGTQPWAALALGVLGHGQRAHALPMNPAVDQRLVGTLRQAKKSERGALALALGLRGASDRAEALLSAFEGERDTTARVYLALALGLLGEERGAPQLEALVESEDCDPKLRLSAGLALGLLGESATARSLAALIAQRSADDGALRAAAEALGRLNDVEGAKALAKLVIEKRDALGEDALVASLRSLGRMVDRRATGWRNVLANGGHYHARLPEVARALDMH